MHLTNNSLSRMRVCNPNFAKPISKVADCVEWRGANGVKR